MRVGQISKLPDANETSRQNVLGETAEELTRRKGHLPLLVAMSVVLPAEGHALGIEGQQAVINDRNTMRIPPEIAKHLGGSAKCLFRVYHPILLEECIDKSDKTLWILQFGDRSWKDEFSLLVLENQKRQNALDSPVRRSILERRVLPAGTPCAARRRIWHERRN